jgi:hypothetical protein
LCKTAGREVGVPRLIRFQVDDWLEWEERVLRPATQASQGLLLQEALAQLGKTVKGGHLFLGHDLTLADIAIFSSLHPILGTAQVRKKLLAVRPQVLAGYLSTKA